MHTLEVSKGLNIIDAYRIVFFAYAALGVVKFLLACSLSKKVEAENTPAEPDPATRPLLASQVVQEDSQKAKKSMLPSISKESRVIVIQLCFLFALDAFASGLVPLLVTLQ